MIDPEEEKQFRKAKLRRGIIKYTASATSGWRYLSQIRTILSCSDEEFATAVEELIAEGRYTCAVGTKLGGTKLVTVDKKEAGNG